MREKGGQEPWHRKVAREVESEIGSPECDWGVVS